MTGPLRTILDAAEWGTAPEQVVRAIGEALDRGWFSEDELYREAACRGGRVARLVATALTGAGSEGRDRNGIHKVAMWPLSKYSLGWNTNSS